MRGEKLALLKDENDFIDSSPEGDSDRKSVDMSLVVNNCLMKYQGKLKAEMEADATWLFVNVSMDEALYLRKIDLKIYMGYKELREALDSMFK
ncbi:auxin-induced protein 22D-like [Curcuma longa]|uniref:auxin-induced protein 22D-like n=1 Tax=Curcuma longa TaxID=136217 RepID=UPI003D9DD445